MDWKLELVAIPVSDVDRAKAFYVDQAGFVADHDHAVSEEIRFVQLTPRGSACSITIGKGVTDAEPGSVQGMQMVVADIEAAPGELVGRGVEVSDVRHFDREAGEWRTGADPEHGPYASFADFADPDGNTWVLQEVRKEPAEASTAPAEPA